MDFQNLNGFDYFDTLHFTHFNFKNLLVNARNGHERNLIKILIVKIDIIVVGDDIIIPIVVVGHDDDMDVVG